MRVVYEVIGAAVLTVGALTALGQYARLSTRRAPRLRQVATAPAGRHVRISLMTAMAGLWLLAGSWIPVVLLVAVIVWELALDGTALVRRLGSRAGSARG